MAMLNLDHLDRIRHCLAEASALANEFSEQRHGFAEHVGEWLVEIESAAREAGLAIVPKVAGLRVGLEAARRGLAESSRDRVGLMPRKARNAAAQSAMRSAIDLVYAAIEPLVARQVRAEDIALHLVSRSFEKSMWPGQSRAPGAPADMPAMWRAMLTDPVLGPSVREISTLVGLAQSMLLVARTMNEFAGTGARERRSAESPRHALPSVEGSRTKGDAGGIA